MTISKHLTEFAGYPLLEWTPDLETVSNPSGVAFTLRLTWQEPGGGGTAVWVQKFTTLLSRPYASEIEALVVGMWGWDESVDRVVEAIAASREKLPNLKAIFVGDITYEENEISWINQGDLAPLLRAFPTLEHFGARGSDNLKLGDIDMPKLKSLRIETGGMNLSIIETILKAKLPELETLVLWLGSPDYGATFTLDDLKPFYDPKQFPNLKHLGLCNSEIADAIAIFMATAPLLQRLDVLDLSMGTLSDEGALALLTSPHIKSLKKLDIHYHFCSDAMVSKLRDLKTVGVEVDISDGQFAEDGWRFIMVGE